jgi:hypothetical protein
LPAWHVPLCSDQTKLDHNQRRRDADADETQVEFSYQLPLIILASLSNSVLLTPHTLCTLSALHGLPLQSGSDRKKMWLFTVPCANG